MLRRFLARLKAEGKQDPSRLREYEKADNLSRDIINCRLRKIASFAAAPGPSSDLLKNMTSEEQALYKQLRSVIGEWKSSILESEPS
jgi:DNA replication initiation complex subunit (GINS family)